MKIFAIGDSITQGFMSGAAARTDLAYPALIAQAMGLKVGTDPGAQFRIPEWPAGGLPINLEVAVRKLRKAIGARIDFWDWPEAANVIRGYMDQVEDYYERGAGRENLPSSTADFFHNVAVQGMDVADAWLVTPRMCRERISEAQHETRIEDGLFAYPSAAFFRTALNVLDPQRDPKRADWSVLRWLEHHAGRDGGVENVLVWLGANNVLGTVVSLNMRRTSGDGGVLSMERRDREEFNVWHPVDFAAEYAELLTRIDKALEKNKHPEGRVFLATVPPVTVAPITAGVGEALLVSDPFNVIGPGTRAARYFKFYTYFLFDEHTAATSTLKLTRTQVLEIDEGIASYNNAIVALAAAHNEKLGVARYHVVDTCRMLLESAYKRNSGEPTYDWPPEVKAQRPMVDTRFHHAEKGDTRIEQGGLFSLDGIHPTAIGHGIIAHEFLKVMNSVRNTGYVLDWKSIYQSDTLYQQPIELMGSIRAKGDNLAKFLLWAAGLKGRGARAR